MRFFILWLSLLALFGVCGEFGLKALVGDGVCRLFVVSSVASVLCLRFDVFEVSVKVMLSSIFGTTMELL